MEINKESLIDVLDENGIRTGEVLTRKKVHEKGKYHRAVHLYLLDQSKQLLLQKRSNYVDHCPGMFSISLTGHVDAGESSYAALRREIHEELGFNSKELEIELMFCFKQNIKINSFYLDNQFNDVYFCVHKFDIKEINFSQDITELRLVSLNEFESLIAEEKTDFSKIYAQEGQDLLYFLRSRIAI